MVEAPQPPNEKKRIECINNLEILYTPAEERFDRITRLLKYTFNVPIVLISLVHTDVQWFKSVQGLPISETSRGDSFCAHAILQQDVMVVEDTHKDDRFKDNNLVTGKPFIRFYAGYPIQLDGYRLGTLCIIDQEPRSFSDQEYDVLRDFAALVEKELLATKLTVKAEQLMGELDSAKRQMLLDPLTNCWNRQGIEMILSKELAKVQRSRNYLGLAMLDVDNFKSINDNYGHLVGDEVLAEVAQRLRISLRPYDSIGRYGGEEFLIILPECDWGEIKKTGNRIVKNMRVDFKIAKDQMIRLSVSVGAASFTGQDPLFAKTIIQIVDELLYKAKNNGRDQLVLGDSS